MIYVSKLFLSLILSSQWKQADILIHLRIYKLVEPPSISSVAE